MRSRVKLIIRDRDDALAFDDDPDDARLLSPPLTYEVLARRHSVYQDASRHDSRASSAAAATTIAQECHTSLRQRLPNLLFAWAR